MAMTVESVGVATTVAYVLLAWLYCEMATTVKMKTHWYEVHTQPVARTTQTS